MSGPPPAGLPSPAALVEVAGLRVAAGATELLHGVDLTVAPGEAVALVGPSGAGKTTLALAVLGHLRPGLRHVAGTVRVAGQEVLPARPGPVPAGYLGQDPGTLLNPYATVAATLVAATGARVPRRERAAVAATALAGVGLPGGLARRYPHQLSGGQQQRVALAVAMARGPQLLVLDEPTAALDLLAKAEVLAELARVRAAGTALLWISHDGAAVARLADRVVAVDGGQVVAEPDRAGASAVRPSTAGASARGRLLAGGGVRTRRSDRSRADVGMRPQAPAKPRASGQVRPAAGGRVEPDRGARSSAAVGMCPEAPAPPGAPGQPGSVNGARPTVTPVLAATGLTAAHGSRAVLHGIDLAVGAAECLAVLGASGAGKSTLVRCLAGLHRPTGTVTLRGTALAADVRDRTDAERAAVALVGQDPADALHPRHTVRTAVGRPLHRVRGLTDRVEREAEIARLLADVGLPAATAGRLPGELSGGQRQRVALARALAPNPSVLLCDEITSALDPRSQAEILELLAALRAEHGLAVVLVTHDAGVAATSDRLLVLRDGAPALAGATPDLLPAGSDPDLVLARLLAGPPVPDRGATFV